MSDYQDLSQLPDPEFLAEHRRVREALEHEPEVTAELTARYQELTDEFLRRARLSWAGGDRK